MTHLKVLHVLYVSYLQLEMTTEKGKKIIHIFKGTYVLSILQELGNLEYFYVQKNDLNIS